MKLKIEDILYEDQQMLIYHKPSGIATQTARLGEQDAVSLVKNYLKEPYAAVIHRLDQPVEGILVFAKTKQAAAALSAAQHGRDMEKKYYAAVSVSMENLKPLSHAPDKRETVLVDYLVKNARNNTSSIAGKNEKDAKRAELSFRIIKVQTQQAADNRIPVLMEVILRTGRHHQIRVQLAHAGMPLLGDSKYGDEASLRMSRSMGIDSVALCACSLTLLHPLTKKKMNVSIVPKGKAFQLFLPINPLNNQ